MDTLELYNILSKWCLYFTDVQIILIMSSVIIAGTYFAGVFSPLVVWISSLVGAYLIFNQMSSRGMLKVDENIFIILLNLKKRFSASSSPRISITSEDPHGELNDDTDAIRLLQLETDSYVALIVRDFIHPWYDNICPHQQNTHEKATLFLESLVAKIANKLRGRDKFEIIQNLVHLFQKHIRDYQEAVKILKIQPTYRKKKSTGSEFKKMQTLEEVFRKTGKVHFSLDSPEAEHSYIRSILIRLSTTLISNDIPEATQELLVEILATSMLTPIINLICEPSWIHIKMVALFSDESLCVELKTVCDTLSEGTDNSDDVSFESITHEDKEEESQSVHEETIAEQTTFIAPELSKHFHLAEGQESSTTSNSNSSPQQLSSSLKSVSSNTSRSSHEASPSCQESVSPNSRVTFELPRESDLETYSVSPGSCVGDLPEPGSSYDSHGSLNERNTQIGSFTDIPYMETMAHSDQELVFHSVSIPNTEIAMEENILFKSKSSYTLYVIQYVAWYLDESNTPTSRVRIVKRRFKEFVNLQTRLEENPEFKTQLKGIKTPNKWSTLPFANMDSKSIESRKKFLEVYLQALTEKPKINSCPDLKEFLAYTGLGNIAFVNKIHDPTLNKMVKTVSGVLDKITILPVQPAGPNINKKERRRSGSDLSQTGASINLEFGYDSKEHDLSHILQQATNAMPTDISNTEIHALSQRIGAHSDGNGSKWQPKDIAHIRDKAIPLAASILDLAIQSQAGHTSWICHERVVDLFKVVLGRALEKFLRVKLDELTTVAQCARYMSLLREALWPEGQWDTSKQLPLSDEEREQVEHQAKSALLQFFPGFLPMLVGGMTFDYSLDQIMKSIKQPILNRNLVYQLIDTCLEWLLRSESLDDGVGS